MAYTPDMTNYIGDALTRMSESKARHFASLANLQAMEINRRKMAAEDEAARTQGIFRTRMAGDEFRKPAIPGTPAQEAVYGLDETVDARPMDSRRQFQISPATAAVAGTPAQFDADMAYQAALQMGVPADNIEKYLTHRTNEDIKREAMLQKFESAKQLALDKKDAATERAAALLREQTNRGEDRDADRSSREMLARLIASGKPEKAVASMYITNKGVVMTQANFMERYKLAVGMHDQFNIEFTRVNNPALAAKMEEYNRTVMSPDEWGEREGIMPHGVKAAPKAGLPTNGLPPGFVINK